MLYNNGNANKVYKHLKSKYGTNGYANFPKSHQKIFKKELEKFQKQINNITVEEIERIWKNR